MAPGGASDIRIEERPRGSGATCRAILATLPTWFGIDDAVDGYVDTAERTPALVASTGGRDVGLLVAVRHFPHAAEVHLMAVVPELHRGGVGRLLLQHAERALASDGVEYLQVKTLSAAHPDPGYARTRAFYEAMGFRALEEFPTLWDPSNPALQLVKRL